MEHRKELQDYIDALVARKGSDIHLVVGSKPLFRVYRELIPFIQKDALTEKDVEVFFELLAQPNIDNPMQAFKEKNHLLFSYQYQTAGNKMLNFRVTAYMEKKRIAIAVRLIETATRTIEELNLPPILRSVTTEPRGLFLVVGPAGSGKSTTIAAMLSHINTSTRKHILTIEDPIEFIFENQKSIITQREVPVDTPTFRVGLDSALRTDADILMVGEMRELETIETAMTAAEVGHLVLSTLHSNSAFSTVHRIVDSFEPIRQRQIAHQLASSLLGICAIHLLPRLSGGLIPACEILLNSPAVANLIRESRVKDIETVIQTSKEAGMMTLEQNLAELVRKNEITLETANIYSRSERTLMQYL